MCPCKSFQNLSDEFFASDTSPQMTSVIWIPFFNIFIYFKLSGISAILYIGQSVKVFLHIFVDSKFSAEVFSVINLATKNPVSSILSATEVGDVEVVEDAVSSCHYKHKITTTIITTTLIIIIIIIYLAIHIKIQKYNDVYFAFSDASCFFNVFYCYRAFHTTMYLLLIVLLFFKALDAIGNYSE